MSDQKDSRQKLKQHLQSLDVGDPEPPLKDAFDSLSVTESAAPDLEDVDTQAEHEPERRRSQVAKAGGGEQAN